MPIILGTVLIAAMNPGLAQAQNSTARTTDAAGREKIIGDLVMANRILFREGIVDAFGHISVRDPASPTHYLMARSMQPPLVTRADIVELDADSTPVARGAPDVSIERFIHGEIYRRRPDIIAIVHSHAAAVLPFTVSRDTPLRAVCHTCGFIGSGAPVFEIRAVAGDGSNMLVQNRPLGTALAQTLDDKSVVLMRGHGFAVAGGSIQEAVYNAINTVVNAREQMDALRLGGVIYLSDAEAAAVSKIHNTSLDRSWEIWVKRVNGELP
jgi:HCOMODA/2-hydroxy-3-carboxy-muconic semialdehyde decarboxylase